MTNPGDYVFPQDIQGGPLSDKYQREGGMLIRDYLAASCMPAIQAQGTNITNAAMNAATVAYALADAMLIVRARATILVNPESIQPKGDA